MSNWVQEEIDKLTDDEKRALDAGSNHTYDCRCEKCLTWWAMCGPDGGVPGNYGPFDKAEVNERQRELGLGESP